MRAHVGVELGQLAFIAAVLAIETTAAIAIRYSPVRKPAWGWRVMPYATGTVAMFWVIQRTAAF